MMGTDQAITTGFSVATGAQKTRIAFTWQLALFLIVNIVMLNGVEWLISPGGFEDTALKQSWDMMRGVGGDDSWGPMAAALEYLAAPAADGKPLYQAIFFDQGIKFQYPPSALLSLEAMNLAGPERVRTFDEMVFAGLPPVNDFIGWGMLIVTAACCIVLLEMGLQRAAKEPFEWDAAAVVRAVLVCLFVLTFYPAIRSFTLGQIQLWINAIFALVLMLFVLRSKAASGALMGLICLMKPHYALVALWAGFNREWRFGAGLIAVGVIGLGLSLWRYGLMNHLDYIRVLSFMSERGESYFANQSVNGVLNRLAGLAVTAPAENETFNAFGFPPYIPWVYWGTIVTSAAILLAAFLRRSRNDGRPLAFAIVAVSLTLASPIAWEHHYGVFLPVFAFMAGSLAGQSRSLLVLALCYAIVSNFVPALNLLAKTPLNVLQSYMLAGGLAFLLLMHFRLTSFNATHELNRQTQ